MNILPVWTRDGVKFSILAVHRKKKTVFLEMNFSPLNKTRAYFVLGVILSMAQNSVAKTAIVEIMKIF